MRLPAAVGGGKSVILARPDEKTPAHYRLCARTRALNGDYWTGEDINVGPPDVEIMARTSRYLLGRTSGAQCSGDPSPFSALGCSRR